MADDQFDSEDLENLPPEQREGIEKEAGREFADSTKEELVKKLRKSAEERFEKAGAERKPPTSTPTGEAGGITKATATGVERAEIAATQKASAQLTSQASTKVASRVGTRLGLRVLSTAFLEFFGAPLSIGSAGIMAVVWFILGWFILPELILKIPGVKWLIETIGEEGCKLIMIFLIIILIGGILLIAFLLPTVRQGNKENALEGNRFSTIPIETAKAEHREFIQISFDCIKAEEKLRKMEEPPIKDGEKTTDDDNKNAVKMITKTTPGKPSKAVTEVKVSKEESKTPQISDECVKKIVQTVDKALTAIEKQVKYFEQVKPKNLAELKKQYEELKKAGQELKDAGNDLHKARAGSEKFLEAHKKLQKELINMEFSCENANLNLGPVNNYGLVYLRPNSNFNWYKSNGTIPEMNYATPKMACFMYQFAARVKSETGVDLEWGDISNSAGGNSGRHRSHIGGGIADFWFPGIGNTQVARSVARIGKSLGAITILGAISDPNITYDANHYDHWHVQYHR